MCFRVYFECASNARIKFADVGRNLVTSVDVRMSACNEGPHEAIVSVTPLVGMYLIYVLLVQRFAASARGTECPKLPRSSDSMLQSLKTFSRRLD